MTRVEMTRQWWRPTITFIDSLGQRQLSSLGEPCLPFRFEWYSWQRILEIQQWFYTFLKYPFITSSWDVKRCLHWWFNQYNINDSVQPQLFILALHHLVSQIQYKGRVLFAYSFNNIVKSFYLRGITILNINGSRYSNGVRRVLDICISDGVKLFLARSG